MASTNPSYRTVASSEQSSSSYLLGSESSVSRYTNELSQRPVTPAESIVRLEWYDALRANLLEYWENICDLFAGQWCAFFGGKLEAIWTCLCLPYFVLTRTLNGRRRYFRPQTGIMYLYLYLGITVILNLIVALKKVNNKQLAIYFQKYFLILIVFVDIVLMLCLLRFTYTTTQCVRSRGRFLRFFYKGGIYIFGLVSFGYSVGRVIEYASCKKELDAVVEAIKAVFILIQIVFLHFFYEVKIPEEEPHIEIVMAHLLGTNLALWFWTLCSEVAVEMPIRLDPGLDKYFLPLFVEFLLLAPSMFCKLWEDSSARNPNMSLLPRYISEHSNMPENSDSLSENRTDTERNETSNGNNSRPRNPSSGLGFIVGGFFAALFVVLVVFSKYDSDNHQGYHIAYSVGAFILYLSLMCACFICQVSLQSHLRNHEMFSYDLEDILLYFSLIGIVLWEGFHAYSLLLDGLRYSSEVLDFAGDFLAIAQHLFQTVTLFKLRRYRRMRGLSTVWICECIKFLMVTNFILWIQDSFFIEVDITTPGERYIVLQHKLGIVGYIVHPLSIFYRFHSTVCCVLALSNFAT